MRTCGSGVAVRPPLAVEVDPHLAGQLVTKALVEPEVPGRPVEPHHVHATVAVALVARHVDRVVRDRQARAVGAHDEPARPAGTGPLRGRPSSGAAGLAGATPAR